ncbi:MAG: MBL fold metallo-hydrolase [Rickettsiales bacterium]|nr:MBL fold metallo-hydrolase [Rickettsiales bacterium]
MEIEIINMNPKNTNSVIVRNDGKVYAFDPWGSADDWNGMGVEAAFATHGHFDHISALAGWDVPWFMSGADLPVLEWSNMILESPVLTRPADLSDSPKIGDMRIIKTPGHSAGSVCFYFPSAKTLVSGDTIFYDCVGRTDLPTGNAEQLRQSIALLKNYGFPGDTLVIPGHGRSGTWGEIAKANPLLR